MYAERGFQVAFLAFTVSLLKKDIMLISLFETNDELFAFY